jgi:hypothetical protein
MTKTAETFLVGGRLSPSCSTIFAILIGVVIGGFFLMAWIDDTVRRAIFSGQTGLRFVTLFSIVIAIILFGITGILQDKELAALLGRLSGYILGRYSAPKNSGGSGETCSDGQGNQNDDDNPRPGGKGDGASELLDLSNTCRSALFHDRQIDHAHCPHIDHRDPRCSAFSARAGETTLGPVLKAR